MGTPFMGEIKIISWNFAPQGWAFCNGQLLPINQNQALFSLLGTMYGGNGQTTFALPDLRARVPIHFGSGHILGEKAGEQNHTLTIGEMPIHTHILTASNSTGDSVNPRFGTTGHLLAQDPGNEYAPTLSSGVSLNAGSLPNIGGSQPHLNMQPFM